MRKRLLLSLAMAGCVASVSAQAETLTVGTGSFNLFKFPSPITEVVLPNDAPVKGQARYADGNKKLLLNFEDSADAPFQMVVITRDGQSYMVNLDLEKNVGGKEHQIGDFSGEINRQSISNQSNPNSDFLPVMAEKLGNLGGTPRGFVESTDLPETRMFRGQSEDGLPVGVVLEPVERLNGTVEGRKVQLELYFVLSSEGLNPNNLDPSQFSGPKVGAITVTRDGEGKHFVLMVRNAG